MDSKSKKPWQDTPDVSARIVTSIGRIASVMRSGMREFATAESLVNASLSVPLLRMDCLEHELAAPVAKARHWKVFT